MVYLFSRCSLIKGYATRIENYCDRRDRHNTNLPKVNATVSLNSTKASIPQLKQDKLLKDVSADTTR
jgi:hypothetical protein